jgi:questin oxidase-like protein
MSAMSHGVRDGGHQMNAASYSSMNEALEMLAVYGPDLRNGMTSHAPMAAEALCAMGRPEAVFPWLATYRTGMLPRPMPSEPISQEGWREALTRSDRTADWSAFFEEELRDEPWRAVLDRWVGRLAPGISASAAHGVIRVGHAVRSLTASESSSLRLRELADGLGYWAAHYQELPTGKGNGNGYLTPAVAITQVAIMPPECRTFAGSIVSSLVGLNDFPEFASAIDLIDVSGDAVSLVVDLAEVFARVYLANAHDFLTSIVFVHAVTSVAALGNILPHVSDATARRAARFSWQTGCALYATFGSRATPSRAIEVPAENADTLVDLAVEHGDEHCIKFTEACLAMHAQRPSATFLAAPHSAMHLLPAAG